MPIGRNHKSITTNNDFTAIGITIIRIIKGDSAW